MNTIPVEGTLSDTLEALKKNGYTHDFSIVSVQERLMCKNTDASLSPEDFQIDEIYRFEGETDPEDEMILFAISSGNLNIKGFLVNAYSIYAEDRNSILVEKLRKKAER